MTTAPKATTLPQGPAASCVLELTSASITKLLDVLAEAQTEIANLDSPQNIVVKRLRAAMRELEGPE